MLIADIQTLFLAAIATGLLLAVSLALMSRSRGMEALKLWAYALLLHSLAYLLFSLRGHIPDFISIVFANVAETAFVSLWILAVSRFQQRAIHRALVFGPIAVTAVVYVVFLTNPVLRITLGNLVMIVQLVMLLYLLRGSAAAPRGPGNWLLTASLVVTGVLICIRVAALATGVGQVPSLFTRSSLQTLIYLTGSVVPFVGSLGFLFMMKERSDEAIEEGKRTLTAIFDSADESIAMFHRNGTLLRINRKGAERFNTQPATMVGLEMAAVLPPEIALPRIAMLQRVAATGRAESLIDQHAGRTYRHYFYPVLGDPDHVVNYATDITDALAADSALHRQLEETSQLNRKLTEAQNQLLQSEKMASLGQLAAGVAHELNNPIGFVHSNLGTLEDYLEEIFEVAGACEAAAAKASNPEDFARIEMLKKKFDFDYIKTDIFQLMAESKDGLVRVKKIVQDLKDFSRVGETQREWVDIHRCLDSTLNIVWNELKYKCTVSKHYAENLPLIYCLASQLNQVFMNLLVNAGQSITGKGEITLTTRSCPGDSQAIQIVIADTGVGIPAENLRRIFEPFFTTKAVGLGTGLGLSIVYGIIGKHGGQIEVQSAVGQGSTFTITLPINLAGAVPPDRSQRS
jgi:signal transduction histidine kinase